MDAALAAFGLVAEARPAAQALAIYPENWQALELFVALQTQWRVGMAGREGLIYSELFGLMDELGISDRGARRELFGALQTMEGEALRIWGERSR